MSTGFSDSLIIFNRGFSKLGRVLKSYLDSEEGCIPRSSGPGFVHFCGFIQNGIQLVSPSSQSGIYGT